MEIKLKGIAGEYLIKNSSTIVQTKKCSYKETKIETVVHIITDSIENNKDRILVENNIKKFY